MKFSLILPTYKVAPYIKTCLESCCNQEGVSLDDYEIIIVNDESPDDSIDVAQRVIDKYPDNNWKIVNRKNGGLSAARNSGINEAKGDYLWFIDSDDYVEKCALSILMSVICQGDFDIINFMHKTVYKNNRIVGGNVKFRSYKCKGVDYLASHKFLSACTCIYKRTFISNKGLRFKEGVLWEDSEFNVRAYMSTDNCFCVCNPLYYYIRRENSISDLKATPHAIESRISNARGLEQYFSNKNCSNYEKGVIYGHIASTLVAAIAGLPELTKDDRFHYRKEILSDKRQYWKILLDCANKRDKFILLCYFLLPAFTENIANKKIHDAIRRSTN